MSLPILRPYQQSCAEQVESIWESGLSRVIAVAPTGSGKTELAKWLMRSYSSPLVIAHTRSLVEQTKRRLGCDVMTVQGFRAAQKRGASLAAYDLLVWDEVHHGDSADWQSIFDCAAPDMRMLGLTATPWRFTHGANPDTKTKNDRYGKGLGDLFDSMVVSVRPSELVRDGYLVPIEVINVVEAEDRAAIKIKGLGPSYDIETHRHTGRIKADSATRLCTYSAWRQYARGKKAIVYSHLVAAAEDNLARFQRAGIPSSILHGKLKPRECSERLAAFARGELTVLVNCMQLTEGVDVPDVECIILDRGCASLNTYIQICGRGARPAPGKTGCLILDLTGASSEHGHPQKDQDYWVCTSEKRNASNQCCAVCGTCVSPMFPTRCMRCDPFIPVAGSRRELLDCGARIYSRLKAATEQTHDDEARDGEALSAMAEALKLPDLTEGERRIATYEYCRARAGMTERAAKDEKARIEAERKAKESERWEADRVEREAFAARVAAERAQMEAARAEQAARRKESTSKLLPALKRSIEYALSQGWTVSWAAKKTRDVQWPGDYAKDNYLIPAELSAALHQLDLDMGGKLRAAELERMLKDERTAKFGQAWCRKKVSQLFGR